MKQREITKEKPIAKFADSSRDIAESRELQFNLHGPRISVVNEKMWLLVAFGFFVLCIFTWLDEIIDLPYIVTGAVPSPFNWHESLMETGLIVIVGLFTVSTIIHSIAENKKKEKLLQSYQDELEIRVREQTAEILKVNKELKIGVAEREKAEQAFRYSEERYALAQRVANIGSWDWDIQTGNLEWSEKIEPMFGFAHGEFGETYEAFLECVHPEDRQHVVDSVNACIEEGRHYDIEHRIVWPNGTVRWVSETGNVIRDENNRANRMLGVVKDITPRKQAEDILKRDKETFENLVSEKTQQLLKTQAELDKTKRLSDIGTLAATVAHELRNPLGVIKTASYNIRRKRKNFLLDKHLDNIEKKISESDQIINNLLSYSRIKIPTCEKIEIYELLNECIAFTKRRFYNQSVAILKDYGTTKKKSIDADPLQMREIFNNVLTNAYQSMPNKKGKIEITTRDVGKNSLEIKVTDNGIGIAEEDLDKIFQAFFTRKSKGTGLGLTICNELVRLHGGKIDVESKKGEGTTVRITLRIKR